MSKKIYLLVTICLAVFALSGCNREKLLILNWGEYINDDLVAEFERIHNVEVSISIADSNEFFYAKAKSGTTAFDLMIPSDYMIERMIESDLIQEIDFTKLSNYDQVNNPYLQGVKIIQDQMKDNATNYHVPYFWGTFGLMYNNDKRLPGLEQALLDYGWDAYFNPELRPTNRVGMYDVAQYAYSTALIANGIDPRSLPTETASGFTKTNLLVAQDTLKGAGFTTWADDALKKDIHANNLDLAYVWTGDFLDMLFSDLQDGMRFEDRKYDIYIPEVTMAFLDAFVIPKKARHVDLAHEFINFFLDPEVAFENASVVGYATPLQVTYDMIINYDGDDQWLIDWAIIYKKYYPDTPDFNGIPHANFNSLTLAMILNMVNNVRTS